MPRAVESLASGISHPGFHVLIVGAGIAGLSASIACREKGFRVTLLESSDVFTHVGAGIFLGGNATRILCDWGLREKLEESTLELDRTRYLNMQGDEVNCTDYSDLRQQVGYPFWLLHRADLHGALLEKAQGLGIELIMGVSVKNYDWNKPAVLLDDGDIMPADVIVAADGYRSSARRNMLGNLSKPRFSGNSAFRALIPCAELAQLPQLSKFIRIEERTSFVWVGPGAHIVGYPIRKGEYFNIVLTQKAVQFALDDDKYVVNADPVGIIDLYKDWDPNLVKILRHLPPQNVLEWKLCDLDPLETWVFPGEKLCLMGDACHAMLPSAAQGAAMGIEDGVVFAELLAKAQSLSDIGPQLRVYHQLRAGRVRDILEQARADSQKWHAEKPNPGVSTLWSWKYDAKEAARKFPGV